MVRIIGWAWGGLSLIGWVLTAAAYGGGGSLHMCAGSLILVAAGYAEYRARDGRHKGEGRHHG